ncbi:protein of unknown function [Methylocaldum szegediense]|uniref:Secreted protein n=1 Tax=Methylocaldum szegediense TaxID=73780 RepID=A0ABN8XAK7_9GAMM|nr:protein of unknown function [Methylocaldum szegediense]
MCINEICVCRLLCHYSDVCKHLNLFGSLTLPLAMSLRNVVVLGVPPMASRQVATTNVRFAWVELPPPKAQQGAKSTRLHKHKAYASNSNSYTFCIGLISRLK